jgi:hypothetical protein
MHDVIVFKLHIIRWFRDGSFTPDFTGAVIDMRAFLVDAGAVNVVC